MANAQSANEPHVVLVGLMGTGKSTLGGRLAERLQRQFYDNDVLLERRTGHTAASLRRDRGEPVLHQLEADVLLDCLSVRPVGVIAAAASTILRAEVREALRKSAFEVELRTDLGALEARLADPGTRPLSGNVGGVLEQQDHDRAALYASIADMVVDTTAKTVDDAVDEVIDQLHQ
jgi:shikimate kinase